MVTSQSSIEDTRTRVTSVVLNWFEDELFPPIGEVTASISELLSIQLNVSIDAAPVCCTRVSGIDDFDRGWEPFSDSLATILGRDIVTREGIAIVVSSEEQPSIIVFDEIRDLGEPFLIKKDNDSSKHIPHDEWGVYWINTCADIGYFIPRNELHKQLVAYWKTRLVRAWKNFTHGQGSDLVNEGLGCIAALAREVINETLLNDAHYMSDLLVHLRQSHHMYSATYNRWKCCYEKLIQLRPLADALLALPKSDYLIIHDDRDARLLGDYIKIISDYFTQPESYKQWEQLVDAIDFLFNFSTWVRGIAESQGIQLGSGTDTPSHFEWPDHEVVRNNRMLVIDDTPEPWYPFLHLLGDRLDLAMDFSFDGDTIEGKGSLLNQLCYYDAVLTDIRFPQDSLKGIHLATTIKINHPELPVIIWSSSDDQTILQEIGSALSNKFIVKKRLTLTVQNEKNRSLETIIESLINRRHAKRSIRLLEPSFDRGILDVELRRHCQRVADASMSLLNSSVEESAWHISNCRDYHGTKHSLRVARNLVRLFEPVFPLHAPYDKESTQVYELFDANKRLTERGLALLYAATFAHDTGVFTRGSIRNSRYFTPQEIASCKQTFFDLHPFLSGQWVLNLYNDRKHNKQHNIVDDSDFIIQLAIICIAHHSAVKLNNKKQWPQFITSLADNPKYLAGQAGITKIAASIAQQAGITKQIFGHQLINICEGRTDSEITELFALGKMLALADAVDCGRSCIPYDIQEQAEMISDAPIVSGYEYIQLIKYFCIKHVEVNERIIKLTTWKLKVDHGKSIKDDLIEPTAVEYWRNTQGVSIDTFEYLMSHITTSAVGRVKAALNAYKGTFLKDVLLFDIVTTDDELPDWQGRIPTLPSSTPIDDAAVGIPIVDRAVLSLLIPKSYHSLVKIAKLSEGFSGSKVYSIRAKSDITFFVPRVAKLSSDIYEIRRELDGYRRFAINNIPADHLIGQVETYERCGRAGYIGAFAGATGGDYVTEELACLYNKHENIDTICIAIKKLFNEVLQCSTLPSNESGFMLDDTIKHWRNRLLKGMDKQKSYLKDKQRIAGSFSVAASIKGTVESSLDMLMNGSALLGNILDGGHISIVHGDLNWRNVFVRYNHAIKNKIADIYLIDYAQIGPGIFTADYAKFEIDYYMQYRKPQTSEEVELILNGIMVCSKSGLDGVVKCIRQSLYHNLSRRPFFREVWQVTMLNYFIEALAYKPYPNEKPSVYELRMRLVTEAVQTLMKHLFP